MARVVGPVLLGLFDTRYSQLVPVGRRARQGHGFWRRRHAYTRPIRDPRPRYQGSLAVHRVAGARAIDRQARDAANSVVRSPSESGAPRRFAGRRARRMPNGIADETDANTPADALSIAVWYGCRPARLNIERTGISSQGEAARIKRPRLDPSVADGQQIARPAPRRRHIHGRRLRLKQRHARHCRRGIDTPNVHAPPCVDGGAHRSTESERRPEETSAIGASSRLACGRAGWRPPLVRRQQRPSRVKMRSGRG